MDVKEKLAHINSYMKNTLMETLEITFTAIGSEYLVATMPVNSRVHQPLGLLHGGASVALAESVGSTASYFLIDQSKYEIRGIEISANHLRSVKSGMVTATAKLQHKGKITHLWEIKIEDENKKLVTLCKMTNIVLPKK